MIYIYLYIKMIMICNPSIRICSDTYIVQLTNQKLYVNLLISDRLNSVKKWSTIRQFLLKLPGGGLISPRLQLTFFTLERRQPKTRVCLVWTLGGVDSTTYYFVSQSGFNLEGPSLLLNRSYQTFLPAHQICKSEATLEKNGIQYHLFEIPQLLDVQNR